MGERLGLNNLARRILPGARLDSDRFCTGSERHGKTAPKAPIHILQRWWSTRLHAQTGGRAQNFHDLIFSLSIPLFGSDKSTRSPKSSRQKSIKMAKVNSSTYATACNGMTRFPLGRLKN